jgi:rfaE bifunctional protein kinase chain/domain
LIKEIIEIAEKHRVPTVVDPKKKNFLSYSGATLFKPNLKELKEGLKLDFRNNDFESIEQSLYNLNGLMPVKSAMVTLSENGVIISDFNIRHHIKAHKREIADVSGAGDTVISIAALGLAAGLTLDKVAAISNLGGGLVCEYLGVVPVDLQQLMSEIKRLGI